MGGDKNLQTNNEQYAPNGVIMNGDIIGGQLTGTDGSPTNQNQFALGNTGGASVPSKGSQGSSPPVRLGEQIANSASQSSPGAHTIENTPEYRRCMSKLLGRGECGKLDLRNR